VAIANAFQFEAARRPANPVAHKMLFHDFSSKFWHRL